MIEYLKTYREDMPQWLKDYKSGDFVPFTEFLAGRVGYYPGSYTDGTLIKVGNMSQSVHCFIQVDYWMERDYLNRHLAMPDACMDTMKSEGWSGQERIYFLVVNTHRLRLPDDARRIGTIGKTLTIFSSSLNATKIVTTVGERNALPWPSS